MEGRIGASDESVSQIEETVKYFKEMLKESTQNQGFCRQTICGTTF